MLSRVRYELPATKFENEEELYIGQALSIINSSSDEVDSKTISFVLNVTATKKGKSLSFLFEKGVDEKSQKEIEELAKKEYIKL